MLYYLVGFLSTVKEHQICGVVAAAALAKHGLYVCIKRGLFGIPTQWRTVRGRVEPRMVV